VLNFLSANRACSATSSRSPSRNGNPPSKGTWAGTATRSFTQVVALAKAFRRDNPGRRGYISVPQLFLAIEDHPRVDTASIVHVLSVSGDPEADGYLKARYGRTLKRLARRNGAQWMGTHDKPLL
jgi:hypothetical protein